MTWSVISPFGRTHRTLCSPCSLQLASADPGTGQAWTSVAGKAGKLERRLTIPSFSVLTNMRTAGTVAFRASEWTNLVGLASSSHIVCCSLTPPRRSVPPDGAYDGGWVSRVFSPSAPATAAGQAAGALVLYVLYVHTVIYITEYTEVCILGVPFGWSPVTHGPVCVRNTYNTVLYLMQRPHTIHEQTHAGALRRRCKTGRHWKTW